MAKALHLAMFLFELIILFLMIKSEPNIKRVKDESLQSDWKCDSIDIALLRIKLNMPAKDIITVNYQYINLNCI